MEQKAKPNIAKTEKKAIHLDATKLINNQNSDNFPIIYRRKMLLKNHIGRVGVTLTC